MTRSEVLFRWESLPLGDSEFWDGPEGLPVRISREEEPEGQSFAATALREDGSDGAVAVFPSSSDLSDWMGVPH